MSKYIGIIKDVFNGFSLVIIILVALFSLLIDGPSYKNKGFQREYRIVKVISYLYITIGVIIFVLLRIV